MDNKGFVAINRAIRGLDLWKPNKPYSDAEAMIDLIMEVNFADGTLKNGTVIKKYSMRTSKNKLMRRWGWTEYHVNKFLENAELSGFLHCNSDKNNPKNGSIVTLEKWVFFDNFHGNKHGNKHRQNKEVKGATSQPPVAPDSAQVKKPCSAELEYRELNDELGDEYE